MRISDWSSDVCSSDLQDGREHLEGAHHPVLELVDDGGHHLLVLHLKIGADALDLLGCFTGPVLQLGIVLRIGIFMPPLLERDAVIIPIGAQDAECGQRSEEHTSELQSLMRISYAVFCLKKKKHEFNLTHMQSTYNTTQE